MKEPEITEINHREIYRYLGCRGRIPEGELTELVESCAAELLKRAEPRHILCRVPLEFIKPSHMKLAGMEIWSRDLGRNLRGCREAYLMAATLGFAPEQLIRRAEALGQQSRALIYDAAASAMIEAYCDALNDALRKEAVAEGHVLRPRFSPGYGDLSLSLQTEFMRMLQLKRQLGITLTESLLMLPSKSVTAVIGIAEAEKADGREEGQLRCADCSQEHCIYSYSEAER